MAEQGSNARRTGILGRLRRRGVLRVAASYAVIAWLLLQIGDVVLEPLGLGAGVMKLLMLLLALGFPVALALAWFLEITPDGIEVDRAGPAAERPHVSGVRRYADLVIIGSLLVVVAWLLAERGGLIEEVPQPPVVAVLPFASLSAEAEDAYFGEGLADTLIHKLGQLNELVVLASQSTFQFSGRDLDLEQVGAKLGATVILLGSVQRSERALRINARLVELENGRQLWSGSYDRPIEDLFSIQDEIAAATTEAMKLVLAPDDQARLATPGTKSLSAYDAYVLGTNRLARRTWDDRKAALEFFEQAIDADPGFVLAYAGLVEGLYLQAHSGFGLEETGSIYARADEAARRALALDPSLGEAWLARAMAENIARDFLEAVNVSDEDIIGFYRKAVDLSPNNAMAHKYFSQFFTNSIGVRTDQARALMEKAAQLDPRSGIILVNVGEGYLAQGDFAAAEAWFRRAINTQEPYFRPAFMQMAEMHLLHTGRFDRAARWSRAWSRLLSQSELAMVFAQDAYLNLDAGDLARETLESLWEMVASEPGAERTIARWASQYQGVLTARRAHEWDRVAELAASLSQEFLEPNPGWPVLQGIDWVHQPLISWSLADIAAGNYEEARLRLEAAYPGPLDQLSSRYFEPLQPMVLLGALRKQAGDVEGGKAQLRTYLDHIRNPQVVGRTGGLPRIEFATLAMLGDTQAALDALERAVDQGRIYQWWSFRDGAFDPDYAAVIADPRFEALEDRIRVRVEDQRLALGQQPELSEGDLR